MIEQNKESIYYVDENDVPTGETAEKFAAHHENTRLHAAFSCYVFNKKGELLVTKRAKTKKVWPNVWTNTVCGHPMPKESRNDALRRRLKHELGMKVNDAVVILPTYRYTAPPYNGIVENEYCPVFIATAESDPTPNPLEVSAWEWINWNDFISRLETDSDDYVTMSTSKKDLDTPNWSWWCKDQVQLLRESAEFNNFINKL